MRFLRILAGLVILETILAAASEAEIKIKVVDPQSAAVARARVELYVKDTTIPLAIESTSPEGLATFHSTARPLTGCGCWRPDLPSRHPTFRLRQMNLFCSSCA